MVRTQPSSTFLEGREEAIKWAEEEERPAASRRVAQGYEQVTSENKITKALEEQRKSIDSLVSALAGMSQSRYRNRNTQRRQMQNGVDASGGRVSFNCGSPEHMARECLAGQTRSPPH